MILQSFTKKKENLPHDTSKSFSWLLVSWLVARQLTVISSSERDPDINTIRHPSRRADDMPCQSDASMIYVRPVL